MHALKRGTRPEFVFLPRLRQPVRRFAHDPPGADVIFRHIAFVIDVDVVEMFGYQGEPALGVLRRQVPVMRRICLGKVLLPRLTGLMSRCRFGLRRLLAECRPNQNGKEKKAKKSTHKLTCRWYDSGEATRELLIDSESASRPAAKHRCSYLSYLSSLELSPSSSCRGRQIGTDRTDPLRFTHRQGKRYAGFHCRRGPSPIPHARCVRSP
jgi:hypothetical protein